MVVPRSDLSSIVAFSGGSIAIYECIIICGFVEIQTGIAA
jgi:hypothetical protein